MSKEALLKKNQIVEIEITAVTSEGNGVGRYEGMAIFVPMTAVGDTVSVRIVKLAQRFAYGKLEDIIGASPHRISSDCEAYNRCGGCSLRHMSYEAELAAKQGWVEDNMKRIGGIETTVQPILPSPKVDRYRNKAQYPVRMIDGHVRVGFFARRSHDLIPVGDCKLQPELFEKISRALEEFMEKYSIMPYDEETHKGIVRHLFIRMGEVSGEVMVWIVVNGRKLPFHEDFSARLREICPNLTAFGIDRNSKRTNVIFGGDSKVLYGSGTITDTICNVKLSIAPQAFYQVNHSAAEQLMNTALEFANPDGTESLLDLYCGAGAIGLSMAHAVKSVTGVEIVSQAVENARFNAEQNGIENAEFILADATVAAEQLIQQDKKPDIIVLDPPRKGADSSVIECIAKLSPAKVVYVSCNSATLARDCKLLAEHGYTVQRVQPVDLFPRTANVEMCVLLTRALQ